MEADECCRQWFCGVCKKEVDRFHTKCISCRDKEQIDKAEKLDQWDGWVFYNDHYYANTEELLDNLSDGELPEYVFICDEIPFKGINADDICQQLTEEMYEDAYDALSGFEDLEKACKAFNDLNKAMVSYYPNFKRMVRVPKDTGRTE